MGCSQCLTVFVELFCATSAERFDTLGLSFGSPVIKTAVYVRVDMAAHICVNSSTISKPSSIMSTWNEYLGGPNL